MRIIKPLQSSYQQFNFVWDILSTKKTNDTVRVFLLYLESYICSTQPFIWRGTMSYKCMSASTVWGRSCCRGWNLLPTSLFSMSNSFQVLKNPLCTFCAPHYSSSSSEDSSASSSHWMNFWSCWWKTDTNRAVRECIIYTPWELVMERGGWTTAITVNLKESLLMFMAQVWRTK